jgi:hypothetical protein
VFLPGRLLVGPRIDPAENIGRVVRTLVGSLGIIAAVRLTTAIAVVIAATLPDHDPPHYEPPSPFCYLG